MATAFASTRPCLVLNVDAGGCAMETAQGRMSMTKAEARQMAIDCRSRGYRVRVINSDEEPALARRALARNAASRRVLLMHPDDPRRAALIRALRRGDAAFAEER